MLKEIFAVILLVAVLGLSILNMAIISHITKTTADMINEISALADGNQWLQAEKATEEAILYWNIKDNYLHSVLNHHVAEEITDDLYSLLDYVYSQDENTVASEGEMIKAHLNDIIQFEEFRLSSIF